MEVTVKLFGAEADAAQRHSLVVRVEGAGNGETDCRAVRAALAEACPALEPLLAHVRFAVNNAYVADDATIAAGDEVALIGLVSGG